MFWCHNCQVQNVLLIPIDSNQKKRTIRLHKQGQLVPAHLESCAKNPSTPSLEQKIHLHSLKLRAKASEKKIVERRPFLSFGVQKAYVSRGKLTVSFFREGRFQLTIYKSYIIYSKWYITANWGIKNAIDPTFYYRNQSHNHWFTKLPLQSISIKHGEFHRLHLTARRLSLLVKFDDWLNDFFSTCRFKKWWK